MYDNKYSEVIVLSSVTSFITCILTPSFEFVVNASNTILMDTKPISKIIEILILSVHVLSLFSNKLLISMKSIETHSGINEVK